MPRMRTISAAYQELKRTDPSSAVTLCGLRTLVLTGAIPSVRVGNKYLLNMDILEKYLQGDNAMLESTISGGKKNG